MSYRCLDLDSRNFVSIRLEIIERKKLDGEKNGTKKWYQKKFEDLYNSFRREFVRQIRK